MDVARKKQIAAEVKPQLEETVRRMMGTTSAVLGPLLKGHEGSFAELAVQIVGQAIMNKHSLSKSEVAEVMIETGVLPESFIRKASGG